MLTSRLIHSWFVFCFLSLTAVAIVDISHLHGHPSVKVIEGIMGFKLAEKGFVAVPFYESMYANQPARAGLYAHQDSHVQIAEMRFQQFCQKCHSDAHLSYSIPPVIHFIWLGSPVTPSVEKAIASWEVHHPQWQIKLWTDNEVANFSWSCPRSKQVFQEGLNWSEKSDILRFEILYQFGGIYVDTDVVCLKSFENLMTNNLSLFAGFEGCSLNAHIRHPLIGSAVIGAAENSKVIKKAIDLCQTKEEAPAIPQAIRTGPGALTKACYAALNEGEESILILPSSYLYPLPVTKRLASVPNMLECIQTESLAIHLWSGSWW